MKLFMLLFTACFCLTFRSGIATTNLLSIYLVTDNVLPQGTPATLPAPDSLTLVSPPVLADADFESFDTKKQTFCIFTLL
jgi:hypothetical protein